MQFIFTAAAEVLRAPLRATDADRFRGTIRARAIHGEAGKIIGVLRSAGCARCTKAGITACQRRECAVHGQALKASASSDAGAGIVRLLLLSRGEEQFGVHFRGGTLRIEYEFLGEEREAHELDAYNVAATEDA